MEIIEPTASTQHEGFAFYPPMKLSGAKVSIKVRRTLGTTVDTYVAVADKDDPQPLTWHHQYTSTYGNVRGGSGVVRSTDLTDQLDEVASEVLGF